jgi:ferredoxin
MRIVVDLNRCQGYAQCVPLAPTVLKLNGEEALMYDPNPDDSLRQQVLRAARCRRLSWTGWTLRRRRRGRERVDNRIRRVYGR